MKAFLKNICFFLIPVFVLVFLLLCAPVSKRLRYGNLNDDCYNHGIRIYDRIFENPIPIDIAFVGSSRTIHAINEKRIQDSVGLKVSSLGYCRLGTNLYYVLVKDLLKAKRPRAIVLEVRETEDRYSHPVFPFLADEEDVFAPYPFYNYYLLTDYYNAAVYKMQLLQELCFGSAVNSPVNMGEHTYEGFADTANAQVMEEARQKRAVEKYDTSEFARNVFMKFPRYYLECISRLAAEEKIPLFFLYMPQYGSLLTEPTEMQTYRQMGVVWLPPDSIYANKDNWYDKGHLNRAGAAKLSSWITKKIRKEILP